MAYFSRYPDYVTVEERKKKAQKQIDQLTKKNNNIEPVILEGGKIARNWWGKAWINNLESYADFSNRLGRGRSYVRNGSVIHLKIQQSEITALVQGSDKSPYKINIVIKPLSEKTWKKIIKECEGNLSSINELLEGKIPKSLQELFTQKKDGLFPTPKEISFDCDCPDWAYMCKHVAAVLYGVGARLDENPSLFFTLRNVNIDDLLFTAVSNKSKTLLKEENIKSRRIISDTDIADVFGIEVDITDKPAKKTPVKSKPEKKAKTIPVKKDKNQ